MTGYVYDDQNPTGRPAGYRSREDLSADLPEHLREYATSTELILSRLDRIEQMLGAVLGLVEKPEKLVTHPYPSPSIWVAVGGRDDAPVYGTWATKEAAEKAQSEDPRGWVYEIVEWEVQQ